MKLTRKRNGKTYVNWKRIANLLATGVLFVGGILFAVASFYALWILLELMQ